MQREDQIQAYRSLFMEWHCMTGKDAKAFENECRMIARECFNGHALETGNDWIKMARHAVDWEEYEQEVERCRKSGERPSYWFNPYANCV